jgi:hypothetical protein
MWSLPYALTIYERRALKIHPCPHCGAPSLICLEHDKELRLRTPVGARNG